MKQKFMHIRISNICLAVLMATLICVTFIPFSSFATEPQEETNTEYEISSDSNADEIEAVVDSEIDSELLEEDTVLEETGLKGGSHNYKYLPEIDIDFKRYKYLKNGDGFRVKTSETDDGVFFGNLDGAIASAQADSTIITSNNHQEEVVYYQNIDKSLSKIDRSLAIDFCENVLIYDYSYSGSFNEIMDARLFDVCLDEGECLTIRNMTIYVPAKVKEYLPSIFTINGNGKIVLENVRICMYEEFVNDTAYLFPEILSLGPLKVFDVSDGCNPEIEVSDGLFCSMTDFENSSVQRTEEHFSYEMSVICGPGNYSLDNCDLYGRVFLSDTSSEYQAFINDTRMSVFGRNGYANMRVNHDTKLSMIRTENCEFNGRMRFLGCQIEAWSVATDKNVKISPADPDSKERKDLYDHLGKQIDFGPGSYYFGLNVNQYGQKYSEDPGINNWQELYHMTDPNDRTLNRSGEFKYDADYYSLQKGHSLYYVTPANEVEVEVIRDDGKTSIGKVYAKDALLHMNEGDTIKLVPTRTTFDFKVYNDEIRQIVFKNNATLDLNNHNIELTGFSEDLPLIYVGKGVKANIIGGSWGPEDNKLDGYYGRTSTIKVQYGELNIEGVNCVGCNNGICIDVEDGIVTCKNSQIFHRYDAGTGISAVSKTDDCNVDILNTIFRFCDPCIYAGDGAQVRVLKGSTFWNDCIKPFVTQSPGVKVFVGNEVTFYQNILEQADQEGTYEVQQNYAVMQSEDSYGTFWRTICYYGPYELDDYEGNVTGYATMLQEAIENVTEYGTILIKRSITPEDDISLKDRITINKPCTIDLWGSSILLESDDPRETKGYIAVYDNCIVKDSSGTGLGKISFKCMSNKQCKPLMFDISCLGADTPGRDYRKSIIFKGVTLEYADEATANPQSDPSWKHAPIVLSRTVPTDKSLAGNMSNADVLFSEVEFRNFFAVENYLNDNKGYPDNGIASTYVAPAFSNVGIVSYAEKPSALRTVVYSGDFTSTPLISGDGKFNFDSTVRCESYIFSGKFGPNDHKCISGNSDIFVPSSVGLTESTEDTYTYGLKESEYAAAYIIKTKSGLEIKAGLHDSIYDARCIQNALTDGDTLIFCEELQKPLFGTLRATKPMNTYVVDINGATVRYSEIQKDTMILVGEQVQFTLKDSSKGKGNIFIDNFKSVITVRGNSHVCIENIHVKNGEYPTNYFVDIVGSKSKVEIRNLTSECYGLVNVADSAMPAGDDCVATIAGDSGLITTYANDGYRHQGLFSGPQGAILIEGGVYDRNFVKDSDNSGYVFPENFGLVETNDRLGNSIYKVRQTDNFKIDDLIEDLTKPDNGYIVNPDDYSNLVGGGGSGGTSGGGGEKKTKSAEPTFSQNWFADANGTWRIKNNAGQLVTNAWLCDDAVTSNGKNVWYLLQADGSMLCAGLVQDNTGNFYSLEMDHNGRYGMLRYVDGWYNCSGQQVYLQFSHAHDGTFGAVINPEGVRALTEIYGLTRFYVGNEKNTYTASF